MLMFRVFESKKLLISSIILVTITISLVIVLIALISEGLLGYHVSKTRNLYYHHDATDNHYFNKDYGQGSTENNMMKSQNETLETTSTNATSTETSTITSTLSTILTTNSEASQELSSMTTFHTAIHSMSFEYGKTKNDSNIQNTTMVRNKRFIDDDDEEEEIIRKGNGLEEESRMYAMQIKVPELPNVDIGRILELYKPSNGYNSYEKTALKELINFVRTNNFQYLLTKMDTNTLFASFQITRGQFIKKLMKFIKTIDNLDRDVLKATDILENCVDNNFDSDIVDVDVIDEIDEMEEMSGRLDIRETLAGILNNATEDVIKAAIDLRKFFRNPDLRFGLLFRGLNYALKELTAEEKIIIILLRLKKDFKTTLRQRENNSIRIMLKYLNYKPENYNKNIKPMDIFNIIKTSITDSVKTYYDHIINIHAIEELDELHSFPDIVDIFKFGFSNETNLAILLRTVSVQSLMSLPPDRTTANAADELYKFKLANRPMINIYEAPKIIVNELRSIIRSDNNIPPLYITYFDKVISIFEKYSPILCSEISHLVSSYSGNELLGRSLVMFRMKLPQKELKIWSSFEKIYQFLNIKQDYESNLPSDYNFADEFTIACRLGNIQEQYRINTISQLILLKDKMPSVFNGMRILRQFPIRTRVIILLNRIDKLNLYQLSDQFKFQLRGIISELSGDDDINEVSEIKKEYLDILFNYAINSVDSEKYKNRFIEVLNFINASPLEFSSALRETILLFDYSPRRQLAMILRTLYDNRLGLSIPDRMNILLRKCLKQLGSRKIGDEQFIGIKPTLERVMDRVFSGNVEIKVTKPIIEAREVLKKLYKADRIDFRYLLRDVRLYKYTDRTQFLILLYRTASMKKLFTDDELYKQYGHAVRTLIHFFGVNLNDIKSESVDLPEEIEELLEEALPNDIITKTILRARNVLIKALETGIIDRRIAYDGIQCYARNASPKKKLEYIIKNIWPIRIDIPSEISNAIHEIKEFSEINIDEDTELPINIYSFDFQEVFDEVITPNEPQEILKAKEILYRDFETNTGRYRVVIKNFVRGKKYPIQEIARLISESILLNVGLTRLSDQKVLGAANEIYNYLSSADLQLERYNSIEQLLTGNAQNYVG